MNVAIPSPSTDIAMAEVPPSACFSPPSVPVETLRVPSPPLVSDFPAPPPEASRDPLDGLWRAPEVVLPCTDGRQYEAPAYTRPSGPSATPPTSAIPSSASKSKKKDVKSHKRASLDPPVVYKAAALAHRVSSEDLAGDWAANGRGATSASVSPGPAALPLRQHRRKRAPSPPRHLLPPPPPPPRASDATKARRRAEYRARRAAEQAAEAEAARKQALVHQRAPRAAAARSAAALKALRAAASASASSGSEEWPTESESDAEGADWGDGGRSGGASVSEDEEERWLGSAALATAAGLPALRPLADEARCLPTELNPRHYARVRNKILSMWQRNAARWLEAEEASTWFRERDRHLAALAWRSLFLRGLINVGAAPQIVARGSTAAETRGSVVVVGAGAAGLAAARQLRAFGYRVAVLEARARPGGRVHSLVLRAGGGDRGVVKDEGGQEGGASSNSLLPSVPAKPLEVVADLGASIITGLDGNPVAIMAAQLKLPLAGVRTATPILPGAPISPEFLDLDASVEGLYNLFLARAKERLGAEDRSMEESLEEQWEIYQADEMAKMGKAKASDEGAGVSDRDMGASEGGVGASEGGVGASEGVAGASDGGVGASEGVVGDSEGGGVPSSPPPPSSARRLFDWHLANVEFSNSDTLDRSSFRHWDQDDPHEMQGSHCFVPGGHSRWVHRLCEGLPIFYDSPVRELCYGRTGVVAHCDGRSFSADAAVVTLPLGVLQAGSVAFSPPLPPRKSRAIARMRFGTLNKVALLFPRAFWGDQIDMFGRLPSSSASRGEAFLFYSSSGLSGGAVLIALMAGRAAVEHEKRPAAEAARRVMAHLRGVFEPLGVNVPEPLAAASTRWGADPYARGAYSSAGVGGGGGGDYDALAEHLAGRVFFAGEACSRAHPSTMHGALESGYAAAASLHAADLLGRAGAVDSPRPDAPEEGGRKGAGGDAAGGAGEGSGRGGVGVGADAERGAGSPDAVAGVDADGGAVAVAVSTGARAPSAALAEACLDAEFLEVPSLSTRHDPSGSLSFSEEGMEITSPPAAGRKRDGREEDGEETIEERKRARDEAGAWQRRFT